MKTKEKETTTFSVRVENKKVERLSEKLKYMSFSSYVNMLIDNDLAKVIAFIALMLINKAQAQTMPIISLNAGTQVTADTRNYSLGIDIGIRNWQGDYGSIGFTTKTYGNKTLCAGTISGLLMINKWLATYTHGDVFAIHDRPPVYTINRDGDKINIQHNISRLEISAGMGLKIGHLMILGGIQADDYDPITDNMKQPVFTSKITYNLGLSHLSKNTQTFKRKSVKPRGF